MASQAQPSGPLNQPSPTCPCGRGRACPPSEAQMCTRSGRAGMEACSGSVDGLADKSWSLHLGALSEHVGTGGSPDPEGSAQGSPPEGMGAPATARLGSETKCPQKEGAPAKLTTRGGASGE